LDGIAAIRSEFLGNLLDILNHGKEEGLSEQPRCKFIDFHGNQIGRVFIHLFYFLDPPSYKDIGLYRFQVVYVTVIE
jgi:hypothetical protein